MGNVRTKHVVTPHSSSPSILRAQRQIYSRGKTPITDERGGVRSLDVAPADARTAGRHLGEVGARYGDDGLSRSIRGLGVTRGWDFAHVALDHAPQQVQSSAARGVLGASVEGLEPEGEVVGAGVGRTIGTAIDRSTASGALPSGAHGRLSGAFGQTLSGVRVHNDAASHHAARMLGARAFTVGQSIYFGEGEYQPSTSSGFHLLAHETAHAVQQQGASRPSTARLGVSAPSSAEEHEADGFADAVSRGQEAPAVQSRSAGIARVMRAITFTRSNDVITRNHPTAQEDTAGATFQIAQGAAAAPHFEWTTDITIHGNAGDPFANFVVGPQQVVRDFWLNIWWGSGANRTHRTSRVTTPIRDTTPGGTTWYHDAFASGAFGADGDVRSTRLQDTPGVRRQPYTNPIAGRVGNSGWFNWGMAFVAYVTAQDTTAGTGAGAFRTLAHVYWNLSVSGTFDGAGATAASRVTVTGGGQTNTSRVFSGADSNFPTMHGGAVFNTQANANLTTT
ncbi:DUF4157 domain-containing protein [Pyxidicoccus sp. MSG2]|uniref:eCIS core domain-containing protein n=1 Tax=Pyxidicoccus sp. MSG2 TaxID=2996790 RepID=UPI00226F10CC|nr:DUF4157 domain-containing protein [Pyxidicoccus sp. MSG2]MCY1019295.1 DUF4157 domain-containing protein [Pyxidicoccus sp. MSG2]